MHRFFVPPNTLTGAEVLIGGETARQISRVLRMKAGDQVCLLDGLGWEYVVSLDSFARNEITAKLVEKKPGGGEPRARVSLYLSLLNKPDKFEWALQKCTELGAARFEAVLAARSVADAPGPARVERWQRIIQEAAEQSGRCILPTLTGTCTLAQVISEEAAALKARQNGQHVALMPALGAARSMARALWGIDPGQAEIDVIIGPEGGFTEEEVAAAEKAGILAVTLGPRTLRAETAAVAALTMALYELGEME